MRKILYILFLFILLFACSNRKNDLYEEYIRQFKASSEVFENKNNYLLAEFDYLLFEHEAKIEPYYKMAGEVNHNKIALISIIDSILEIRGINDKKLSRETRLNKQEIDLIRQNLKAYENTVVSMVKDKIRYSELIIKIENTLSTQNFESINTFSSKTVSGTELLACFYKLEVGILIAENDILNYLFNQVDVGCSWSGHLEAFVVPNSEILPAGFPYRAQIFLAAHDTTASLEYEIEGKKYELISGVSLYKYKVTEKKPGKYQKKGNFIIKSPYNGEIQKIPFKIEYEVLKSK